MHKNVGQERKLHLRSEEVQEILDTPPVWIVRWGITLIFMFVALVLIMSFFIRYPDFVSAKVLLATELPTERIVARSFGELERIFVQNGSSIEPGQPLAVIKNTADFNHVDILKRIISQRNVNRKDFTFPVDSTSILKLGEIESAYINFERSYLDYALLIELRPYANDLWGQNQSQRELKIQLLNQMDQIELLNKEFDLKNTDFQRYKVLYAKGVISQQEYEAKEVELLQIRKNLSSMAISISQLREAITSSTQRIKGTFISSQEDDTRYSKQLKQAYNMLQEAIREWESKYILTSSLGGVVSFQEIWGNNQYISVGDVVFTVLPHDTSKLVGKLLISSQNAGKVALGQKVLIKLDNFPYQQYGMLIGSVRSISVAPNKDNDYIVYISLMNGTKSTYNRTLVYKQELLGNAEIITEELSLAQRLLYKFRELFRYG